MPRVKVVLDTNVVVSAHLNDEGYPSFVVDLCLSSRLQWFVSPEIIEEYEEVLRRKRLRIEPKLVEASLRLIEESAKLVRPRRHQSEADYLVTGNKRHFPERLGKTRVVSPRELIEIITPELNR